MFLFCHIGSCVIDSSYKCLIYIQVRFIGYFLRSINNKKQRKKIRFHCYFFQLFFFICLIWFIFFHVPMYHIIFKSDYNHFSLIYLKFLLFEKKEEENMEKKICEIKRNMPLTLLVYIFSLHLFIYLPYNAYYGRNWITKGYSVYLLYACYSVTWLAFVVNQRILSAAFRSM